MRTNRSIPDSPVIPVLTYPDVRAAVAWLSAAFGFTERVRVGDAHRSQMRAGDGAVMIADVYGERVAPRPGHVTHSVLVRVEDADAHCARATRHGARILSAPTNFPYGERQYNAEDLAGHVWTFSQTLVDIAPESWGGLSVADAADRSPQAEQDPTGRPGGPAPPPQ